MFKLQPPLVRANSQEKPKETREELDKRMLNRVIHLSSYAQTDPDNYRPFGAAVVRNSDRKILAECLSDTGKSHDPTAHGEVLAIREACKVLGKETLEGCTLYSNCEPCAMCSALIHITKLNRLVYACAWDDVSDEIDIAQQFKYVATSTAQRSTPSHCTRDVKAAEIIKDWYKATPGDDSD